MTTSIDNSPNASPNALSPTPVSPRRAIVLSLVFMLAIVVINASMAIYVLADPALRQVLQIARVAIEIDRLYQQEVNWNNILDSGMDGMLDQLDRYSTYHPPEQFDRISEEFSGSYVGIGVTVIRHDQGVLIMSVRENGPAAKVGLLTGDIIVRVDSVDIRALPIEESTRLLRGRENTQVDVQAFRPAVDDTLDFTVTRREIDFEHIPFAGLTRDSVLYIRLLDFDAGATDDLEAALDSLLDGDHPRPHGIIVDLRDNPGGLLSEAYEAADLFLDGGQFIVGTRGRSRWEEEKHYSSGDDMTGGLPLALLVDNGSASSAEIFAGSLHQLHRAVLVGDTTFGKGLVQGFTRYPDGSALRLTVSRYYLEGNLYLNEFDSTLNDTGRGLVPDYPVAFEEYQDFPMELEYSLLLREFAQQHADEIVAAADGFALGQEWVDRFGDFARQEGFEYTSPLQRQADLLVEIVQASPSLPQTERAATHFAKMAASADQDTFTRYRAYIARRLKQLAVEHQLGTKEAYRRAIINDRPDILQAIHILREPAS